MMQVPVLVALISTELLVFVAFTSKAFRAEAIVEKDRGDDVRKAVAGLEAASLIPRLASLFEYAERTRQRRRDELPDPFDADEIEERRSRLEDLLTRAGDIAPKVTAAALAGEETREPLRAKEKLVRTALLARWPLVVAHVSAPLFLLDTIRGSELGPQPLDTTAAIVFGVSAALALVVGIAIAWREKLLAQVIANGKDATPDE